MRENITNTLIQIFQTLGYEVTEQTKYSELKDFGMINIGLFGDEIEYEFDIVLSIADLKPIFKGSVGDTIDWILKKKLVKECD